MADFYAGMATMAEALLNKRGQTIEITRSGDIIDPVTGDVTSGADTVYKPKGVLLNYKDADIDGTRIVKGDRLLILDATTEPKTSDKPVIDGAEWTVVAIESINPAGTPVAYKVQVRR
jgi:hypothetical protein